MRLTVSPKQYDEAHKYFLFELRRVLILARLDSLCLSGDSYFLYTDIANGRELWKEAQKYA